MVVLQSLSAVICLLYALLVGLYARYFWRRTGEGLMRPLLVVTILAHLAFFLLAVLWLHLPILNTPMKMLSALALSLAVAYFLIEAASRERGIGVWVLGLSFIFQLFSNFGSLSSVNSTTLPQSPLLVLHIGLALVGYCAFALSVAFSVMYLHLYHEIKIRHLGVIFERLPSLDMLETMGYRAVHFGLGFLVLSLVLGEHLLIQEKNHLVLADPKILMSFATCVYYGLAIAMRRRWSIQGKRFAIVSIAGFLWILILLFAGRLVSNFHHFA